MPLKEKLMNWLEDALMCLPAFSHLKKEQKHYEELLAQYRKEASHYTRRNITEKEIRKVGRQWNRSTNS